MLSLLRIEWMKLKNYRTFWILLVLYLISIFAVNYIVYYVQNQIYQAKEAKGVVQMIIGNPPFAFPQVWQMTSYVSSFLLFLPGLLMVISITNEYSYKTHRQNIIDGWSRLQFIRVKITVAALLALASTIMVALTAFIFGLIEGSSAVSFEKTYYLIFFFIQALSYSMVAILFSIFLKRGGLAIGVFFLYSVALENVVVLILNHYTNYFGRYFPLQSADALISAPVFENVQKQMTKAVDPTTQLILALIYLGLYFFISQRKFTTDDL